MRATVSQLPYSRLDWAFAKFLTERATLTGKQKKIFESLILSLSYHHNQGHNCLLLNEQEQALIVASGLATLNPSTNANLQPLVLEDERLYLQRYWFYEHRLMVQLHKLTQRQVAVANLDSLLDDYQLQDQQRLAAAKALEQHFCIITGGPGTGKTTTVVKILALLQQLAEQPLLIALAAPTGKAAMRLSQSIIASKANSHNPLPCSEQLKNLIPETATTLHYLLGAKPASPYFKHHADHPLIYDLVVIDEASMVDLALMSKLLDALKPDARLILLGDKDQLASVESGAVLADLSKALPKHTVELTIAHRFDSHIKQLADAVNQQHTHLAWQSFTAGNSHIALLTTDLIAYIASQQAEYLQLIAENKPFAEIYQAFNRFQVLCANREGKNGVADINYRVEQKLAHQGRIRVTGFWYVGRPILITQNNPSLQLYNGDIGLCLLNKDSKLVVLFQRPDGTIKRYLPSRISQCETVFAMTIHKSQGSEFDEVLIVLPEQINPVLTKELLYTAITRAKKTVKLSANQTVFNNTLQQKVSRITGLEHKFRRYNDAPV